MSSVSTMPSLYGYRPSLALSFSLVAVYSTLVAAAGGFVFAIVYRRNDSRRSNDNNHDNGHRTVRAKAAGAWLPYTLCLGVACLLELAGYICRVDGWERPAGSTGYRAQLLLLLVAPGFITAALALSLEKLTTLLGGDAGAETTARVDGKKYSRILLPLCATGFVVQAIGAALAGHTESNALEQQLRDQQPTTTTNSPESRYAISAGDMVVIIGLVLQLNALCIAGYRLLVVIWRQSSFRPPAVVMRDGLLELENASSGWRRRLLAQSHRGGGGGEQTEMAASRGQDQMPDVPPPAAVAAQRDLTQTAPSEALGGHHQQHQQLQEQQQTRQLMTPVSRHHKSGRSGSSSRLGPNMFSITLVASTILILARTAYRIVEFAQPSLRHGDGLASAADGEVLFAMFDSFFVALATLLLLVVAHPLLTLSSVSEKHHLQQRTREERVNAWYLGAAGAGERHRRIQDWVEGITLGGAGGGGGNGEAGSDGVEGGGRRLSRRLSWVSRRTGWTGRSGGTGAGGGGGGSTLRRYREEEEDDGVVEPGRARITTYR